MAPTPARMAGYDAFISYSQAVSGELATALQAWLERFATPWYRPRSLRIFRDYTSLSASDDLWETIERAVSASRHFILLASPEAAQSAWVNREVEWWRAHRPARHVYVVLTGGELAWDAESNDWDWAHTTSLPPAARGMFTHEPLWVDLSSVKTAAALDRSNPVLLNSVAQIAAPLRGVDKDTIVGQHITYYRRARRQRRSGIIGLVMLTVLALLAAYAARTQADNANSQARIATARALAVAAEGDTTKNLSLAQSLAVEAYQLNPDATSRSALLQAVTASPQLVRYLAAGSAVTGLAASADGQWIVAGTQGGQVLRWATDGFGKQSVGRLRGAITSVAVSADGNTVAAASGAGAFAWTSAAGVRPVPVPSNEHASLTAVSPDGRFILVYSQRPVTTLNDNAPGAFTLLDLQTGKETRATTTDNAFTDITMPSDDLVVALDPLGLWERRAAPNLALTKSGNADFGATQNYAAAVSPDGTMVTDDKGGPTLPIYQTTGGSETQVRFQAATAGPEPNALAISPNGHEAVTADNGSLYVSAVTRATASPASAQMLTGNSAINSGALAFAGDASHLVSGSGSLVAYWDLSQLSRIGTKIATGVPATCAECPGSWLSVSPDDKTAIFSDFSDSLLIQPLGAPAHEEEVAASNSLNFVGPAVWRPDGKQLLVPTSTGIQVRGPAPQFRLLSTWRDAVPLGFIKAMSFSGDGKRVIIVGSQNVIQVRNAGTGQVMQVINGPGGANADALGPIPGTAAINSADTAVAVVMPAHSVDVISLRTGKATALDVADVQSVSFGGGYLAVLLNGGGVRLWDLELRQWTETAGNYLSAFSISNAGTMLAEYSLNDSVVLQDPRTDTATGSFDLQSPIVGEPPSLTFTADGTRLLVALQANGANFGGELEQWSLSDSAWLRAACLTAGAGLTAAQWRAVVGTQAPATLACAGS